MAECTHKALIHRIAKIRALGKGGEASATGGTASPTKPKTPVKGEKAVASPTKKAGKGAKKQPVDSSPMSESDGDSEGEHPARARPKRATPKRNYAQMAGEDSDADGEEDDGLDKKVKIEVGEDVGEGLRGGFGGGGSRLHVLLGVIKRTREGVLW